MSNLVLQPLSHADIPELIKDKSMPEQLDILRDYYWYTISFPDWMPQNNRVVKNPDWDIGIFIKDVGLLCFDGNYFVTKVWEIDTNQNKYFIVPKNKWFQVFHFDQKPTLWPVSNGDNDVFTKPEVWIQLHESNKAADKPLSLLN